MHIEIRGSGPALVLLHGWAMHAGIFEPLLRQLDARFTLHLVDLPGHGHAAASAAPLALDCADALIGRVPPALWLGWSLGGLLALHAALRHPHEVQGLIMLCASPRFVSAPDWPEAVPLSVFERFDTDLQGDYRGTLERFLALQACGSAHVRGDLRHLRAQLFARGEPAVPALQDGLRLLEHVDLRHRLPQLQAPSLWIAGRCDRLVPWQALRRASQRVPRGEFACVAGAGHAPFLAAAEHTAQLIVDFATRHALPRSRVA